MPVIAAAPGRTRASKLIGTNSMPLKTRSNSVKNQMANGLYRQKSSKQETFSIHEDEDCKSSKENLTGKKVVKAEQKSGVKNLGVQTEIPQYKDGGTQTELSWEELILEDSIFKFLKI